MLPGQVETFFDQKEGVIDIPIPLVSFEVFHFVQDLGEHLAKAGRAASQENDRRRNAVRLFPEGKKGRTFRLRNDHHGIAARKTSDPSEFVAQHQQFVRSDTMLGGQLLHPGEGIGLVGQSDLDVLDVAGDPRVLQALLSGDALGDLESLPDASGQALFQALLHRIEEFSDRRLGGVMPFRDEIDLAAVEPIENQSDFEAGPFFQLRANFLRALGQQEIFLGSCGTFP